MKFELFTIDYDVVVCVVSALFAMAIAIMFNPIIVKLAYDKRLLDKPDWRKVQKNPVPVIGGLSVFFSMTIALLVFAFVTHVMSGSNAQYRTIFIIIEALSVMFFIGFLDDCMNLSYKIKFCFQILVISFLWYSGFRLDSFHGFLGLYNIEPWWMSYLFSVFAGVGIMNAINLIDGIDGLSSGFGISANLLCCLYFLIHYDSLFAIMAAIFVGTLVPFFVCNVFSNRMKMFIGDAGTLILGTLFYIFACRIIHEPQFFIIDKYQVSMTIAIFAVPVFDTVRVMIMRILHGKSPFLPDKTHIHHIFLEFGLPHFIVTLVLHFLMAFICFVWIVTSYLHLSVSTQTWIVIGFAVFIVWGIYFLLHYVKERRRNRLRAYMNYVFRINNDAMSFYQAVQSFLDKKYHRRKSVRLKQKDKTDNKS